MSSGLYFCFSKIVVNFKPLKIQLWISVLRPVLHSSRIRYSFPWCFCDVSALHPLVLITQGMLGRKLPCKKVKPCLWCLVSQAVNWFLYNSYILGQNPIFWKTSYFSYSLNIIPIFFSKLVAGLLKTLFSLFLLASLTF